MKRLTLALLAVAAVPAFAAAETWDDVHVIDTMCFSKFESKLAEHTKECALQCASGGYGLVDAEGDFLEFDAAGNEKTLAALKRTDSQSDLRATVVGERKGDTIAVTSISIR